MPFVMNVPMFANHLPHSARHNGALSGCILLHGAFFEGHAAISEIASRRHGNHYIAPIRDLESCLHVLIGHNGAILRIQVRGFTLSLDAESLNNVCRA